MSATPIQPATPTPGPKRNTVLIALAIIIVIVGATWWMGERNGWASIGTGGVNAKLLPKVGDEAPEFFTLREDEQPMLLSQYRGQPVWINFWGSWCGPCREEMPEFIAVYDQLTEAGVVILPVSIGEEPAKAVAYRNKVGGTFPVYMDPAFISGRIDAERYPEEAAKYDDMRSDWQINNYPTHIFIDPNGIVRNVILRQMTESEMIDTSMSLFNLATPEAKLPEIVVSRFE